MNLKDNRGYMLVEIILASAIAFGIAYFITSLTIKVKNKNDDTLVSSQVATDQAIITNGFMRYAIQEKEAFDCDKVIINGNKIQYDNNVIDIVNDYADVGEYVCDNSHGEINIVIPLSVVQMKNKDYNVNINYKYLISDIASPQLVVDVDGFNMTIKLTDNEGIKAGSYTIKYGHGAKPNSCNELSNSITLTSNGEKEITRSITLDNTDTLYVCNLEDIPDLRGNILPSTRPIKSYSIVS